MEKTIGVDVNEENNNNNNNNNNADDGEEKDDVDDDDFEAKRDYLVLSRSELRRTQQH